MADLLEHSIVSMTTPPWMEQFSPKWLSTLIFLVEWDRPVTLSSIKKV